MNRETLWIVISWLVKLIDIISIVKLYFIFDFILLVNFRIDIVVGI